MLPSFCRDTITIMRPTETNSRGTVIHDWTKPTSITITGCSVQANSSSRDFDGRTLQVEQDYTLYAPPGADVKAGDRVSYNDTVFEVNGAPMPVTSPTGRVSHVWARLHVWSG